MMDTKNFDPFGWLLGGLGTIALAWIGTTTKKVNKHETEIAVLKEGVGIMKESLNRLEVHFGTRPKE
jgi:hypothetical protein